MVTSLILFFCFSAPPPRRFSGGGEVPATRHFESFQKPAERTLGRVPVGPQGNQQRQDARCIQILGCLGVHWVPCGGLPGGYLKPARSRREARDAEICRTGPKSPSCHPGGRGLRSPLLLLLRELLSLPFPLDLQAPPEMPCNAPFCKDPAK